MFWIPSNKPLDLSWLQGAPSASRPAGVDAWLSALQELGAGLKERPLFFLPLLLLIAALLWWRNKIDAKLSSLSEQIGHFRNDSQLHPAGAIAQSLLALPGALFLALCGYLLQMDARGQNYVLGAALYEMAQAAGVLQRLPHAFTRAWPSCTSAGRDRRWRSCGTRFAGWA